jgi:hypothetical protein
VRTARPIFQLAWYEFADRWISRNSQALKKGDFTEDVDGDMSRWISTSWLILWGSIQAKTR